MDFIKKNARVIVIAVLAVAIIGWIAIASQDNNQATDDQQAAEQQEQNEEQPTEGNQPTAVPGEVTVTEESYSVEVQKGDNQTKVVRRMIDKFLADNNKTLQPAQKLYVETNLVNSLPRNDLVFAGQTIQLNKAMVQEKVSGSEQLTADQLALWARYL